jgi:hypothetical protein
VVLGAEKIHRFATDGLIDVPDLRERLGKMNDPELLRFGQAARFMCSRQANFGKPPRQNFVIQLEEAKLEWMRRQEYRKGESPNDNGIAISHGHARISAQSS